MEENKYLRIFDCSRSNQPPQSYQVKQRLVPCAPISWLPSNIGAMARPDSLKVRIAVSNASMQYLCEAGIYIFVRAQGSKQTKDGLVDVLHRDYIIIKSKCY